MKTEIRVWCKCHLAFNMEYLEPPTLEPWTLFCYIGPSGWNNKNMTRYLNSNVEVYSKIIIKYHFFFAHQLLPELNTPFQIFFFGENSQYFHINCCHPKYQFLFFCKMRSFVQYLCLDIHVCTVFNLNKLD